MLPAEIWKLDARAMIAALALFLSMLLIAIAMIINSPHFTAILTFASIICSAIVTYYFAARNSEKRRSAM